MIVYHQGRFYVVTPWTRADLQNANMAYEAREITQPYHEEEKKRVGEIRKAVNKGCMRLIEIEPYEV